jgi:hypothetical protein
MRLATLLQGHRNVPIRNIYGPTGSYILAFAERQLLAKSRRQRPPPITTGIHPTTDIKFSMSVFRVLRPVLGAKLPWFGIGDDDRN